jgi:hypothetical protein
VFSSTREEYIKHLNQILERMRITELYANPDKCVFYEKKVEFLRFIISEDGVLIDPSQVNVIVSWKEPESYHEI